MLDFIKVLGLDWAFLGSGVEADLELILNTGAGENLPVILEAGFVINSLADGITFGLDVGAGVYEGAGVGVFVGVGVRGGVGVLVGVGILEGMGVWVGIGVSVGAEVGVGIIDAVLGLPGVASEKITHSSPPSVFRPAV